MSLNSNNILKPQNNNILNEDFKSKRYRPDEEKDNLNNNQLSKRWSLGVEKVETDRISDLGIGMLEADEVMNPESASSDIITDDPWEYPIDLPTNSEINENTPCCSTENKENNHVNVQATSEKRREIMRDWKEHEEFCILRPNSLLNINRPDLINTLSDEVILQIFKWLPKASLMQCSVVSKRFCRLSRDESLWMRLDLSCRSLYPGSLGPILERGVQIFRLAQTEIHDPAIFPSSKALSEDFQSKLQYLDLSMAVLSLNTLSMLFKRCRYLKKLSLENVPVDVEICKYISQNERLEILNMTMVTGLNITCMKYLLTSLVRLKELNIAWTNLNNIALGYVCNNLPYSLTRLNIAGCRKTLVDSNVRHLVNSCPNLKELDLSDCTSLTYETVEILMELENLRFLAMSRCYAIPPAAFKKLKLMSSLESFDIHGHMPEAALQHLKEYFGDQILVNKFLFSSVARPTVGIKRTSIWNLRVKD